MINARCPRPPFDKNATTHKRYLNGNCSEPNPHYLFTAIGSTLRVHYQAGEKLLRAAFCVPAVLGILTYFPIRCGSCAPAARKLPALATFFISLLTSIAP